MNVHLIVLFLIVILISCRNISNNSGQKTFLIDEVSITVPDSTAKYYEKNNDNKFIKWKNFTINVQTGYMPPDIFLELPTDTSITFHNLFDNSSYKIMLYTTSDFVVVYIFMDMTDAWITEESYRIVSFKSIANDKNEMIKILDVFKTITIRDNQEN